MTGPETSTVRDKAPDDTAQKSASASTATSRSRRRGAALPWFIALLTTAALVFVALQWLPLRAVEAERIDVATAARDVVTRLTTWDARDGRLTDTIDALAEIGTTSFAADVDRFFAGPAGEELVNSGAASTALVKDVFVQAIDGDTAAVFVVLDQSVSTVEPPATNVLPRRAVVELVKQDGRWVAADVTVTDGVFTVPDPEPEPTP